jgi:transcriptional regulator with XRE-family HTH domain
MEQRMAAGLKQRREQLGLTVGELAERSEVSRAMISKIERREVSPTAVLLGRLCNGLGITLSSLIASAESPAAPPLLRAEEQPVWRDPQTGLVRTMVNPPHRGKVEIVRIELPSGAEVHYREQLQLSYEQQVLVLVGKLTLQVGVESMELNVDDCIHLQTNVSLTFTNRGRSACRYLVVINR